MFILENSLKVKNVWEPCYLPFLTRSANQDVKNDNYVHYCHIKRGGGFFTILQCFLSHIWHQSYKYLRRLYMSIYCVCNKNKFNVGKIYNNIIRKNTTFIIVLPGSTNMLLKGVSFGSKDCTKELKLECAYFLARIASFCHLGVISDPLIVSKFHNETHYSKGQENKIYTIVSCEAIKRERFLYKFPF